ncbi:MAG: signal peptidase I [Desulfurococcales archaeon]|nr:signal peptidase I [Desulfurococcales archaeon]
MTYSAVLLLIALALPRILSGQGESVESYYTIEILVLGTALAPALVRGARRSRSLAYGGLGAVFGYLTVVLLSAATGTLGRGLPVGYSSILPLTASLLYGLTIGVPVAVLASAHRDRSISYSLAGIASLVVPVARLAGGSWGFQGLVGVALASYLTGVSSAVIADKWGRPAGALYYSLMFALITSGPLGIGGSLLLAGAVIGAGSMAGAGALFLLEDGSPAKLGGSWTRSVMPRTRRGIIGASVTAALVIAGALLYMYGFVFWRPYAIVTGSMEPSINRGDLVFIRHVDSVSVGDVVTYRKGRMIVTHRVYQIFDDGVRTKGDANVEPDPYIVPYRDILGRVVLRVPLLGWPLIWANWNRAVRLALVSLSLAGLVLVAFWPRRASGHTG